MELKINEIRAKASEKEDEEASFTKEEMQSGKHQEFEQKLIKLMIQKETESERNSNHHTNHHDSYSESNNGSERLSSNEKKAHPRPISQPPRHKDNSWNSTTPTNNSLPHRDNNRYSPSSLSSSLDEKGEQQGTKLSPNRNQNKTNLSPRHQKTASQASNNPDEDSSQFSSGCSSMTNTPPPPNITPPTSQVDPTPAEAPPAPTVPSSDQQNATNRKSADPSPTVEQQTQNNTVTPPPPLLSNDVFSNTSGATNVGFTSETINDIGTTITTAPLQTDVQNNANRLFIANSQAETTQSYLPFPTSTDTSPEINNLLNSHATLHSWTHSTDHNQLSDTIPIKTGNDWEAAFGFTGKTAGLREKWNDPAEDDLGFDPWVEKNKGLADLIQEEAAFGGNDSGGWGKSTSPFQHQQAAHHQAHQQQQYRNNQFPNNQLHNNASNHLGIAASLSSFANSHNNLPQGGDQRSNNIATNNFITNKKDALSSPRQQQHSNSLNEWQNGLVALLPSSVKVNFATSDNNRNNNSFNNFSSTQQQTQQQQNYNLYDQWSSGLHQQQSSHFSLFGNSNKTSSFFGSNGLIGGATNDRSSNNARVAPPPGLSPFAGDPAIIASSATNLKSAPPPPSRTNTHLDDTPHWMKSLQMLTLDGDHGNNTTNNDLYDATRMAFSGLPTHTATQSLGGGSQPPPGFHSRHLFAGGNNDFGRRHGGLLENQS